MDKVEVDILLKEYEVCEQDNAANSQVYWTLSAIFIGLSTALFGGLIYAVLTNNQLFNILVKKDEPNKTLIVGIIAIIVGIAMMIILTKLKGWLKRIQFNQRINQEIMREIELRLGMNKWWRIPAVDKWYEDYGDKEPTECHKQVWDKLRKILAKDLKNYDHSRLDSIQYEIVGLVQRYFPKSRKDKDKTEYEPRSSLKHYPCILHTLMSLWVIVVTMAVFLIIAAYFCWQWGLVAGVILIPYICYLVNYYLVKDVKELNKI